MQDQKFQTLDYSFCQPRVEGLIGLIPKSKEFNQNYRIYRVKLNSIEISQQTRDELLTSMDRGKTYVQIGDYTVMVNSIASIEPLPLKDPNLSRKMEEMRKQFNDR